MNEPQPAPNKENHFPPVWPMVKEDVLVLHYGEDAAAVINDMDERDKLGESRYGTRLRPFNGREAKVDAYQEILDCIVYTKQAQIETSVLWHLEEFNTLTSVYTSLIEAAIKLRKLL